MADSRGGADFGTAILMGHAADQEQPARGDHDRRQACRLTPIEPDLAPGAHTVSAMQPVHRDTKQDVEVMVESSETMLLEFDF